MDGLIYAYHAPKSTAQQAYAQARVAQLAAQRKERKVSQDLSQDPTIGAQLVRVLSSDSAKFTVKDAPHHCRNASEDSVEPNQANMASSTTSLQSDQQQQDLLNTPFEFRHGRRYLREVPYPLPCDLVEIQRQNLQTLLGCKVFGRPVCSFTTGNKIPKKVLEIGCGSGYWSAMCHDYFRSLGARNISFTGLDLAPLAPDLRKQGINWRLVQHDIRRVPLPFDDETFDLVMLKDLSMVLPLGTPFQRLLAESVRILRPGGALEIWDADHVFRSILPHPPSMHSEQAESQDIADMTGTFIMTPDTPFAPAQDKYIAQANKWIGGALDRRKLTANPCARIADFLLQEPNNFEDIGIHRIAIPLGQLRWERFGAFGVGPDPSDANDSPLSVGGGRKDTRTEHILSADQRALRQTALVTVLQMIESLEPLLKETSGKSTEEWSHWWTSMMANLTSPAKNALNGECLEVGAWWATKGHEK